MLQPILPKPSKRGGPPTDQRWVVDAILYVTKRGAQWRLLPINFPPWQTVYHIFRKWTLDHTRESINAKLRGKVRQTQDKRTRPTAAILDSQSVKSDPHGGDVGYDAAKRLKGRKRHVLADTLGLLLGIEITPANTPERDGAQILLQGVLKGFARLRRMWVDGGYSGPAFAQWVRGIRPKLQKEGVKRSDSTTGFAVLPRRWVVERTFGWFMRNRRLVRNYETSEDSAKPFAFIAMIRIQLRRLA